MLRGLAQGDDATRSAYLRTGRKLSARTSCGGLVASAASGAACSSYGAAAMGSMRKLANHCLGIHGMGRIAVPGHVKRPVARDASGRERRGPALGGQLERAGPAASSPALSGGQRHAVPRRQEYQRIRGIGSILQPAGRRGSMRRARRLRVGMKGENIASTSAFLPLFRCSGCCSQSVAGWPRMGFQLWNVSFCGLSGKRLCRGCGSSCVVLPRA